MISHGAPVSATPLNIALALRLNAALGEAIEHTSCSPEIYDAFDQANEALISQNSEAALQAYEEFIRVLADASANLFVFKISHQILGKLYRHFNQIQQYEQCDAVAKILNDIINSNTSHPDDHRFLMRYFGNVVPAIFKSDLLERASLLDDAVSAIILFKESEAHYIRQENGLAFTLADAALKKFAISPIYLLHGTTAYHLGKHSIAATSLTNSLVPKSPAKSYFYRAMAYTALKKYELARMDFLEAMKKGSPDYPPHIAEEILAVFTQCEQNSNQQLRGKRLDADFYHHLGDECYKNMDFHAAINNYTIACWLTSNREFIDLAVSLETVYKRFCVYCELGDLEACFQAYQDIETFLDLVPVKRIASYLKSKNIPPIRAEEFKAIMQTEIKTQMALVMAKQGSREFAQGNHDAAFQLLCQAGLIFNINDAATSAIQDYLFNESPATIEEITYIHDYIIDYVADVDANFDLNIADFSPLLSKPEKNPSKKGKHKSSGASQKPWQPRAPKSFKAQLTEEEQATRQKEKKDRLAEELAEKKELEEFKLQRLAEEQKKLEEREQKLKEKRKSKKIAQKERKEQAKSQANPDDAEAKSEISPASAAYVASSNSDYATNINQLFYTRDPDAPVDSIKLTDEEKSYLIRLENLGGRALLVGGLVGERLLNKNKIKFTSAGSDIDIVTNVTEQDIRKEFKDEARSFTTFHDNFGVTLKIVFINGQKIDIRLSDKLDRLSDDAKTRDFTFNTLYADKNGCVYAPIPHAIKHLYENKLHIVSTLQQFKTNQKLIFRAIDFESRKGKAIPANMTTAIQEAAPHILEMEPRVVNTSFNDLLNPAYLAKNFGNLLKLDVLKTLFPSSFPGLEQHRDWVNSLLAKKKYSSINDLYALFFVLSKLSSATVADNPWQLCSEKALEENPFFAANFKNKKFFYLSMKKVLHDWAIYRFKGNDVIHFMQKVNDHPAFRNLTINSLYTGSLFAGQEINSGASQVAFSAQATPQKGLH
jgi:tRNA nucleotidyltransferase/poly(A) polymerase